MQQHGVPAAANIWLTFTTDACCASVAHGKMSFNNCQFQLNSVQVCNLSRPGTSYTGPSPTSPWYVSQQLELNTMGASLWTSIHLQDSVLSSYKSTLNSGSVYLLADKHSICIIAVSNCAGASFVISVAKRQDLGPKSQVVQLSISSGQCNLLDAATYFYELALSPAMHSPQLHLTWPACVFVIEQGRLFALALVEAILSRRACLTALAATAILPHYYVVSVPVHSVMWPPCTTYWHLQEQGMNCALVYWQGPDSLAFLT